MYCSGNFNSWDRVPFITNSTGTPGTSVVPTVMEHNLVISNYDSTWPIDHDDCSCYYHDSSNLLVYAGAKNYLGMSKVTSGNVYIDVDLNGMKACAVDDSTWSKDGTDADIFANNVCITGSGDMYHDSRCDPHNLAETVDKSFGNRFFTDNTSQLGFACGRSKPVQLTLESFQAKGYEKGSTVTPRPSNEEIVKMGRKANLAPCLSHREPRERPTPAQAKP